MITGEMVTYLFQQSLKEDGIQTTVENMSKWESSLNGGENKHVGNHHQDEVVVDYFVLSDCRVRSAKL